MTTGTGITAQEQHALIGKHTQARPRPDHEASTCNSISSFRHLAEYVQETSDVHDALAPFVALTALPALTAEISEGPKPGCSSFPALAGLRLLDALLPLEDFSRLLDLLAWAVCLMSFILSGGLAVASACRPPMKPRMRAISSPDGSRLTNGP
mmetsp:Transcript_32031/g.70866  ORF Transcript_32031/g.70866 Transcript_32031/m.70866 type:complete len:153 (-) Transcript_32031:1135-1593(-)